MQIVNLDLSHFNFYCPVTGQLISNDELFEESPATVFSYIDEVQEFQKIVPDLEEIWKKIEDEADEDDFPWDLFEKFAGKIKNDSIVCFQITTRGMACGPVSSTVRIGINMDYQSEDQQ